MNAVTALTVSDDMEVVIPREVSEALRLKPGQKLEAVEYGGQITLIPYMTMREARGFLGPMDTTVVREPDREF